MNSLKLNNIVLDINQEPITISKKVFDVADISGIFSSVTRSIALPMSSRNMKAFNFLGLNQATTTLPYDMPEVELMINGVETLPLCNIAAIGYTPAGYDVIIKQGNGNFFSQLEGLTLKDLAIPLQLWNMTTITYDRLALNKPMWAVTDFGITPFTGASEITFDHIFPSVPLPYVFSLIESLTGWTIAGDVLADSVYTAKIIPCLSDFASDSVRVAARCEALSAGQTIAPSASEDNNGLLFTNVVSDVTSLLSDDLWPTLATNATGYHVRAGGLYTVVVTVDYNIGASPVGYIELTATASGTVIGTVDLPEIIGDGTHTFNTTVTLAVDDIIYCYIRQLNDNDVTIYNTSSFAVTECVFENSAPGTMFDVAFNLPDLPLVDVLRNFMLQVCAFAQADVLSKTLTLHTYNDVFESVGISQAYDLSKYYAGLNSISYEFDGLSRVNTITYAVDNNDQFVSEINDIDNIKKDFVIPHLTGTQDYVKLDYAYTGATEILNTIIPVLSYSDVDVIEYQDVLPRCINVFGTDTAQTYKLSGYTDQLITVDIPYSSILFTQMSYFVGIYWNQFITRITQPQIYSAEINIPIHIFQSFDFSIPIFISQLNAYFQVLEFENYTGVKPCTVKLLKL